MLKWKTTTHTYFKIHDPAAHHDTDIQKYRCSLVKRQINNNTERIDTLNIEAHNVRNKLKILSKYMQATSDDGRWNLKGS